jgi:Cu(I)/Ag(I) efflux system membrane fusion protein
MPAADATPAVAQHHAAGTVEQVGPQDITISHGPVASLQWGPMTMAFKLPSGGLPAQLRVGDKVDFAFSKGAQGGFVITAIRPASASASASAGSMVMPAMQGGKP